MPAPAGVARMRSLASGHDRRDAESFSRYRIPGSLNIPLLRGRGFEARDTAEAPGVVVVNQTLAERFFPGQDAVGKRFRQ